MFRRIVTVCAIVFALAGMSGVQAQAPCFTYQKYSYLSQTSNLAATTFFSCSSSAAQDFRVSLYITGAGSSAQVKLLWTDENGAQNFTYVTPPLGNDAVIHCAASSAVQVQTLATSGTYDLWITVLGG